MSDDENRAPPPTEELVQRARSDPRGGFADLYGRVAPAVFGWISLHVREPLRARLDPEDVLQEVVCRAYERFATFDPERSDFRGWIFGIARNVLREVLRGAARGRSSSARSAVPDTLELPDSATRVSQALVRDERLAAFLELVRSLPEEERRLLIHRGLEGLPHEQVAELLDLAPEVVTRRWSRLRERLRARTDLAEILAA
jgi:RNA polymerase sigma-70 factor (ECF subfamily)